MARRVRIDDTTIYHIEERERGGKKQIRIREHNTWHRGRAYDHTSDWMTEDKPLKKISEQSEQKDKRYDEQHPYWRLEDYNPGGQGYRNSELMRKYREATGKDPETGKLRTAKASDSLKVPTDSPAQSKGAGKAKGAAGHES